MTDTNFIRITPFMHVPDLAAALEFFSSVLGFHVRLQMDGYAYIERDTIGIRLMQNQGDEGAPAGNRRFAYYIDVRDVDALYAELKPKLDTLPPRNVHGPANQPYGQRELLVLAPDGNLLAFGQAIATTSALASERAEAVAETDLATLRSEIDEVDEELVKVLARRFAATEQVGRLKAALRLSAVDEARELQQQQRLRQLAEHYGLDRDMIQSMFRIVTDQVVKNHRQAAAGHGNK